ncbi:MAG: serine/threonine protein kinase [Acidobacteria bacterium]|nr:MAG: serine/threonine protein kinase [Acidobacteriota bacterium]
MHRNPAITPPAADTSASPDAARFAPGYVLAGRYRMITRLGKGGMGEVWRADDLVLETPVALKLIYSADPEGRQRILNEVRLARQITHPAVCRVFDVIEGEGEVFYSMELVRGEDLATLVRRLGRLPSEKVVEIGQELCDGLAAAHAQGVLHRDLKPANVLIDEDGFVRITDFGIAVTRDAPAQPSMIGTPGYMAPEQLDPAAPLSERTDIYAVGLILYELLVGRPAFDSQSDARRQPPKPSASIADVDSQLERAIFKAIEPEPRDRPASVRELSDLLSAPAKRRSRVQMWVAGALAAAATLAIALFFTLPAGGRLTEQDTIVLADFLNTTGEPVFDGALKVALAVALEQSPFLKVYPDNRVREALRLMQRPPDERITRTIAREVARREQLKALVSGSIASLGSHYVLALEAINAETGEVLAREQAEIAAKEQVLESLGSISSRLREKLGESLAVIERFDVPLAQATTRSLEALHAYSLALDQGRMDPRLEAVPHLQRALELDPNFAMAQALLSGVYANNGRSAEAPIFSRRAFELRNRVSERERFFISWRYYVDAEQAWDKALDLGLSWTRTYPREAFAFNSLGMASAAFGQHEQAAAAFREAIRLDPRFVPPHRNLAGSLIALNRFDEANALVEQAASGGGDIASVRRTAYLLAFLLNDSQALTREMELVRRTSQPMWADNQEARTSAFSGRVQAAHDLYQRAVKTALGGRFQELGAQWAMEDAELHAIAGQCGEARREIAAGLELNRDNFTLERAGRAYALCNGAEAARLSDELRTRFPAATLTVRIHLPVIAAALAVSQRDFPRAIKLLEPVKQYDHAPAAEFWPLYLRGEAYLGLRDGAAAAAQFRSIVDRRGIAPTSPLYALAHLGAARAAALAGDDAGARESYEAFFGLWSGADSLRWLEEGRREYARFQ